MLGRYLRAGEAEIVIYHLQSSVAQDLSEREDITAVQQVIDGKGGPAEVGVEPSNARLPG